MTLLRRLPLAAIALTVLASAATQAQTPRTQAPTGVAISPDGTTLAFTLRTRQGSTLHLTSVANPDPAKEQLVTPSGATSCSNSDPVWSPDSATLAFTSTCTSKEEKPGQEQIFLWSKSTATATQLTHLTGLFEQPAWSPDGRSIAFLFVENATRSAGALDAMKPFAGVIGEDGVEIQRVYQVKVADGTGTWLTPAQLHVYEFAWSPTSTEIAFIAANPPGENTWWIAKLYVQSLAAGQLEVSATRGTKDMARATILPNPSVLLDPTTVPGPLHGLQIAVPRYSPDGKQIAFIGGLMSDQGSTGGDVWVVPSTGGVPTNVTPNIDGTPTFLTWTGNDGIGFVEDRRGHTLFADYGVKDHTQHDVDDLGEVQIGGGPIRNAISVSTYGVLAFTKSGIGLPPEVYAGGWKQFKQITHLNDGLKLPAQPRVESIEWTSAIRATDPTLFHVQGWLTYPVNYDPAKKYPMIVTVHGGPSASAGPPHSHTFADLGYFEFNPNPRGSFGQGEAFVQANRNDFGYGDLRDILAGVDFIEKRVSIDDHRLGLTGWSYGGFMSMFAETQTTRFRAIVAGAGISNWLSYYGENSIDQWMTPFFGASVYDDPAAYARSSAITFIKNSHTPMLIIVGDRDGECPAPQSFEMWHALKAVGVKTQLVVYPNEGHGFRDPAHIRDRTERTIKWFAENMPQ